MTPANKRIETDIMNLMMSDFKLEMINNDDNLHAFFIKFHGPEDSVYHGYVWKLRVKMPFNYPYVPPVINFITRIYHPNIDEEVGGICVNVLNESWSPITDLVAVFEQYIPQLLKYPNLDDPLNLEAAALLMTNPSTYAARVQEYCRRYATSEKSCDEKLIEDEMEELSEDETLEEIDNNKMGNQDFEEGKDDDVSGDENVAGKSDDP